MRTVVQIEFNGHFDRMTADLPGAFAHMALDLNDRKPLGPLVEDYPMLAAAGVEIGPAYRLAHLARLDRRESVDVVIHDLDALPGRDSVVDRYALVDPRDPCALVAMALLRAEETEIDLAELEEELAEQVRGVVGRMVRHPDGGASALRVLQAMRDTYGSGTSDAVLVDYDGIVPGPDVARQVASRAIDSFDAAATKAFTDEESATPSP